MAHITGNDLALYRLKVLLKAGELELKGMRRRGVSAITMLRREFNLKGPSDVVVACARSLLEFMGGDILSK